MIIHTDRRVKVIEFVDAWTPGGVEKYIIQLLSNIDKEKYNTLIWTTQKKTTLYDEELINKNIDFIVMKGVVKKNPILRIVQSLCRFRNDLNKMNCDVFHLHASNGVVLVYAYIAKKIGVPKVIVHSHSSNFGGGQRIIKKMGHRLGKILFSSYADLNYACSDLAAEWLFRKKQIMNSEVEIVDYFVDTERFKFCESVREEYRDKYFLKDEIVFLNIGRFHYQKNQMFLLEIFKLISNKLPSKLFIIGEGDLETVLKKKAEELDLNERVFFVGTTNSVEKYMSMADIFILPSLYEGNPITVTEAQASGLICFLSNSITKRAKLLPNTYYMNVNNIQECVECILKNIDINGFENRIKCNSLIKQKGYNINEQIKHIENAYL